jgi:hypothetical protein
MPDFIWNLWAGPPENLSLACPAGAPGQPPTTGFFDPDTVRAAYQAASWATLAAVVVWILVCYLWTRTTLGPRFVHRWWLFGVIAAASGFVAPLLVLHYWPTRALAGSCQTNPTPFLNPLPWSEILQRGLAGLLWAAIAYVLLSLVATRLVGWLPASGGFFHNRGCPAPRFR